MRVSSTKYVCDVCQREIEYNAFNKRKSLVFRTSGVILMEESSGNICEKCRELLKGTISTFLDIIKEESLRIEDYRL